MIAIRTHSCFDNGVCIIVRIALELTYSIIGGIPRIVFWQDAVDESLLFGVCTSQLRLMYAHEVEL